MFISNFCGNWGIEKNVKDEKQDFQRFMCLYVYVCVNK